MGNTRIHIRIDDEKKQEWEEYVESDPDLHNLSNLVRTSVEKEVNDYYYSLNELEEYRDAIEATESSQSGSGSDEVLSSLKRIEDRLDTLEAEIGAVAKDVTESIYEKYDEDVIQAVFDSIPQHDKPPALRDTDEPPEPATIEEIAEEAGVDPDIANEVISEQSEGMSLIRDEYDDETDEMKFWMET